jgi:DNA-binding beta-propeller fold protein YncE
MKTPAVVMASAFLAFFMSNLRAADLRGARLYKSSTVQISGDGTRVWCVNPDNDSVTRIDVATESATEFPLPVTSGKHFPRGLSIKEDGSEVWLTCHDSDRVCVLDAAGALLARIDLPWGSGPFSIALSPNQQTALVTLHRGEALAVLDVPSRRLTHLLKHVFWAPMGIAWAEGGNAAWVTHIFSPGEHPLQTRVDFSGPEPRVSTAMRILPADPRQSSGLAAPYNVAEGGYLNIRGHPAQIPGASGRNELWLPTQYHNMTGDAASPDATVQSVVRRLRLSDRTLLTANADKVIMTALHVHNPTGNGAYVGPGWNAGVAGPIDIAFSVDGQTVCVLNELSRDLVVMPVSTTNLRPTNAPPLTQIKVGDRPIGVALSPVSSKAYVLNQLTRDVSVVDLGTLTETKRIPVTPLTGEPLPAGVLLGAKLFHSSDDPRISRGGKMACASCHLNAEHDGRVWQNQILPGNHGPRATQMLLGLRLGMGPRDPATGFGQLHRSGDRDEVQDFEQTFQGPQMGGAGFLGASVHPELGAPNAGRSPELDALASYLLFLDPLWRSPQRAAGGGLSEAAIRGATFFAGTNRAARRGDAGCVTCHLPETSFTDFKFHNVGQRRDAAERELNNRAPAWSVNTPSLVGAWATAPYVGSISGNEGHSAREDMIGFLRDAVGRANTSTNHGRPDGLTPRQMRDLAEFVLSIDGNMTAVEVRNARDTTPPRIERAAVTSLSRIDVWFSETVKPAGATNPANWSLTDSRGLAIPITGAVFDNQNGDHVILTTVLQPHSTSVLMPIGSILDDADAVTGNTANAIDVSDPANRCSLIVGDRLTITLGASGYENLTIPVHDSAMVGPGLANWSHDSVWLSTANSGPNFTTAFLRFDWASAFRAVTGVTNTAQILDARFTLTPELGDSQRIELRRCLQRWADPAAAGDFNSNPTGGPTWNSSAHGTKSWNLPGAARVGGNGTATNEYFGINDLASRLDATVAMVSITEPAEFGGALVTDAFRFWFENPAFDNGYALRLAAGSRQETKFDRWESGFREKSPVLKLTYLLPGAPPRLQAVPFGASIRLQWPVDHSGYRVEATSDPRGGWTGFGATVSSNGTLNYIDVPALGDQQFFRLAKP